LKLDQQMILSGSRERAEAWNFLPPLVQQTTSFELLEPHLEAELGFTSGALDHVRLMT
jgi:hypothetical protein